MPEIHPTALVDSKAQLHDTVSIGPYAIVEAGVVLGANTRVLGHAQVLGNTEIGTDCTIGHGAIIGGDPQAKAFDPQTPSKVIIGDRNIIREHVTIHRSMVANGVTRLGNDNFLMASSHVGHDAVVTDECILANAALLAGHVHVARRCFLGGGTGVHQFIRLGEGAMIQGNSATSQDVPPFCVVAGINGLAGLNAVGLKRQGYTPAERMELKQAYAMIFRSGHNLKQSLELAAQRTWSGPAVLFLDFLRNLGPKGVVSRVRDGM
jgi:UDP-N-acetylglucosamine acyltransferase